MVKRYLTDLTYLIYLTGSEKTGLRTDDGRPRDDSSRAVQQHKAELKWLRFIGELSFEIPKRSRVRTTEKIIPVKFH